MLSFAFKNTHTISECLEREVRGGDGEEERGRERRRKGEREGVKERVRKERAQNFLILTQRAQRHAISPNYEGRECWGRGQRGLAGVR